MGYLEKEFILHKRGEDKNLLPIDFFVKELDADISVIPVTRGEFFELGNSAITKERIKNNKLEKLNGDISVEDKVKILAEIDEINEKSRSDTEYFIIKHINIPRLTREDLNDAKTIRIKNKNGVFEIKNIIEIFMDAIHSVSGVEISIENEEEKLKKK